eukprot:s2169_g8.t1
MRVFFALQAERRMPEFLRTLEGRLEIGMAYVATALERAAEPEFAVAESPDELALELLGGGPHSPSLPVVRLMAATTGCGLAARGTAAAAPIVFGVGSRREEPPPRLPGPGARWPSPPPFCLPAH